MEDSYNPPNTINLEPSFLLYKIHFFLKSIFLTFLLTNSPNNPNIYCRKIQTILFSNSSLLSLSNSLLHFHLPLALINTQSDLNSVFYFLNHS